MNLAVQIRFLIFLQTIELIKFLSNNRIQIIHNNRCADTRYSWLAGKITRIPIIIHHRDSKFFRLDNFLMKHVDRNICISTWQKDSFVGSSAMVIHNGIELDKFPSVCIDPPQTHKIEVGLVGRISPIKGQDVFIKAAEIVLKSKNNIIFKIIGDIDSPFYGEYKDYIRALVKEAGLEGFVIFTGYANDVVSTIQHLDISVVPSLREPFGRVIIESMACAKPVVATNVGGALDIITKETGLLFPVNDHEALAEALIYLIENPKVREEMGKAGRERVAKNFTIENTLGKVYNVYSELAL